MAESCVGKSPANVAWNVIFHPVGEAMRVLRSVFPDAEADEMNFVLFSTSGVHGSYATIEEVESDMRRGDLDAELTFLLVRPRLVGLQYGNVRPENADDIAFLKKLRASSHRAVARIGVP